MTRKRHNYRIIEGLEVRIEQLRREKKTLRDWALYSFVLGGIAAFGAGVIVGLNV